MAIFISYGHAEKIDPFITELTSFLTLEVDETVWTDKKLRFGDQWATEIDNHIFVSDIFLFIQTKEAVREGSYCYGEIEFAERYGKRIIILKVDDTMDSALFINCQKMVLPDLLDESYNINNSAWEKYKPLIKTLKGYINEEKEKAETDFSKIVPCINFDKSLHPHVVDINLKYMSLVKDINNSTKNILCFTGMPGSGKSYIISEIYRKINQEEKAIHFFQHNNANSCNISSLLYTIAACLAKFDNDYREFLKAKRKNLFYDVLTINQLFDLLFKTRPAVSMECNIFVLIDGIDELSETALNELIIVLSNFSKLDSPKFKFIMTTRHIPSFISHIQALGCILESDIEKSNYAEMRNYIMSKYPTLRLSSDDLEYIVNVSHGDYIYLKFICEEIADNPQNRVREISFPHGMHGVVCMYLDRTFDKGKIKFSDNIKNFISILCASVEPLNITQIGNILHISESEVCDMISILNQFLTIDSSIVKIGHKSLYDAFTAMSPNEKYYVSIQTGKKMIADWCKESFIKKNIDNFVYKYGMQYVYENLDFDAMLDMFYIDDGRVSDAVSKFVISQIINKRENVFGKILNAIINSCKQYPRSLFKILKMAIELKALPNYLLHLPDQGANKQIAMLNDYITFFIQRCASANSLDLISLGNELLKYSFDAKSRADVLRYVADAYRHLGNHAKAIYLYNEAINLCSFDKNSSTYLDNYCALLDLDSVSGNIKEVIAKIDEIRKSLSVDDVSLNNYKILKLEGEIYKYIDKKKALDIFEKSKEIAARLSAVIQLFDANNNVAEVTDNIQRALSLLNANIKLHEQYGYNALYYGKTCTILSDVYLKMQDFLKAKEWALKAMDTMSQINYRSGLANAQVKYASACFALNEVDDAKMFLLKAIRFYEREQIYPALYMQALNKLYDICDQSRDIENFTILFAVDNIKYKENFPTEYQILSKNAEALGYYKLKQQVSEFLQDTPKAFNGYYNNNYKFHNKLNRKDYIVRVKNELASQMDFRAFEETSLLSMIKLDFAPKPYMKFIIENKGVSLLNFIEGVTLNERYPSVNDVPSYIIKKIAQTMAKLHSYDITDINEINTLKNISVIESYVQYYSDFIINKYNEYLPRFRGVFSILKFPKDVESLVKIDLDMLEYEQISLCHGDVHQKNIIINSNDDINLIDWEFAMLAPKSADIAIHLHRMKYSDTMAQAFLDYYIENDPMFLYYTGNVKEIIKLEEIKTVIVDVVRYLNILTNRRVSEVEKGNLINNYISKLQKAYKIWQINSDIKETTVRVAALFNNVANTRRII